MQTDPRVLGVAWGTRGLGVGLDAFPEAWGGFNTASIQEVEKMMMAIKSIDPTSADPLGPSALK